MNRIATFEKVSKTQFFAAKGTQSDADWESVYDEIVLPKRATKGSAGYDFFAPFDITLQPGEAITVPTGIRAKINEGWVLMLFPRSGLGFKFRLQLNNTVGIIDADYYDADNEGHIFCKITNDTKENKTVFVEKGKGFCQGIFVPFGVTTDDETDGERSGGFGSTDK